jgi:hypothetical protein
MGSGPVGTVLRRGPNGNDQSEFIRISFTATVILRFGVGVALRLRPGDPPGRLDPIDSGASLTSEFF